MNGFELHREIKNIDEKLKKKFQNSVDGNNGNKEKM